MDAIENPKSEADVMQEVFKTLFSNEILQHISGYLCIFQKFVKLNEGATLKKYIDPQWQIDHPLQITTSMYGTTRRILNATYGHFFPIDNEVQAYVLGRIRAQPGMHVCEIACASGEIGILYAYAGAHVTFNDIEPREIAVLKKNLKSLPKPIQKKCTVIEGTCLDLLTKKPDLKEKMDIVVCRNLLHFLRLPEQIKLLGIVKSMLKTGGQAIFTANSIYPNGDLPEDEGAPSAIHMRSCFLESELFQGNAVALYRSMSYCQDEEISPLNYHQHYLYLKNQSTEGKWIPCKEKIKHTDVPKTFLNQVKATMQNPVVRAYLRTIPSGTIKATSAYVRLYNVNNLARLFTENGFSVTCTFIVNGLGHLVLDYSKRFKQGNQVGIIATKK
jgi:SAM-dependent methyltransferase